jgi:hypothetical protein
MWKEMLEESAFQLQPQAGSQLPSSVWWHPILACNPAMKMKHDSQVTMHLLQQQVLQIEIQAKSTSRVDLKVA